MLGQRSRRKFLQHAEWELLRKRSFATHSQARRVVSEYIDQFFNPIRRHSTNGYFSPIEFELRWQSCQFTIESMCPQNSGKLKRPWHTRLGELGPFRCFVHDTLLASILANLGVHEIGGGSEAHVLQISQIGVSTNRAPDQKNSHFKWTQIQGRDHREVSHHYWHGGRKPQRWVLRSLLSHLTI